MYSIPGPYCDTRVITANWYSRTQVLLREPNSQIYNWDSRNLCAFKEKFNWMILSSQLFLHLYYLTMIISIKI